MGFTEKPAVHDHPHANTDSIIGVVREDLGEVSHQAVYDVLRALTAAGLVRRFQPSGSVARYEARVGDNHHVVCRPCGPPAGRRAGRGGTPMTAVRFRMPPGSEATAPPERRGLTRDGGRLLVARPEAVTHHHFAELEQFLEPGDLLVVNTSATLHLSASLNDSSWIEV